MVKQRKIKPEGADGHRSRMFAKFLNSSPEDVLLRDIIEMLLFYSVKMRDTRDSAVELMKRYDGDIRRILTAPPDELCMTDGIGPRSALLFNVVGEIISRLESSEDTEERSFKNTLSDILCELLDKCLEIHEEAIAVIFFNTLGEPIETHIFDTTLEGFDGDNMYLIMSLAAGYNSSSVIVAHLTNAPDMFPTANDTRFKRYISDALQTAGLTLTEYYFISRDEAISLSI